MSGAPAASRVTIAFRPPFALFVVLRRGLEHRFRCSLSALLGKDAKNLSWLGAIQASPAAFKSKADSRARRDASTLQRSRARCELATHLSLRRDRFRARV